MARYKKYEAAGEVKIVNATTDEFCDAFKGTYIGMCGPLALAVHSGKRVTGFFAVLDTLQYNSGRTLGYIALGIIAGLLGSFANIGDGQRVVSVMIGLSLVFLFLFT